jgi:integrase
MPTRCIERARTAIGEAHRRGYVSRNVLRWKPPRVEVEEVEPYTVEEVRAILAAAELVPNRARWVIALALGLRQGEVLGLRWSDVDLDRGLLWVRKSRVRPANRAGER